MKEKKIKARVASRFLRFKALTIDIFLLYVPILYLFYFILGSKDAFLQNSIITALCPLLFGFIQALFLAKSAQSPGLKAYDLYLMDLKSGKKPKFLKIILRYFIFFISFGMLIGLFFSFFRKDGLNLHDILTRSCIIKRKA